MNLVTMRAFRDELSKIAADGGLAGLSPTIVGAGIGAVAAFGAQVIANKAPKGGGKSSQQMRYEQLERDINAETKNRKKQGKQPTFYGKMKQIAAKPMTQMAALATKHPAQAAIPAAILGAYTGALVAKHLTK
jgi:hypothetical protein